MSGAQNVVQLTPPVTRDPDQIAFGLARAWSQLSQAQTATERRLARFWFSHWKWLARLYTEQQVMRAEYVRRGWMPKDDSGVVW